MTHARTARRVLPAALIAALVAAVPAAAAPPASAPPAAAPAGAATAKPAPTGAPAPKPAPADAPASKPAPVAGTPRSGKGKRKPRIKRVGGPVRRAWPARGASPRSRPPTALTRWLARQVGPREPLPCVRRPLRVRARCAAREEEASRAPSAPRAIAASTGAKRVETVAIPVAADPSVPAGLKLIRSFDIPADDPDYDRLLNWAWTYDSAAAAVAFASVGQRDQAARLLDQLSALQRKDGSIEFAFDVASGEAARQIRAGTVAWTGIAFVDAGQQFGEKTYLDNARLAADYLLGLRNDSGLVRGGPDVTWVSTQHNLLAYIFLSNLAQYLSELGDGRGAAKYQEAAEVIAKGIDRELVVRDPGTLWHFRQGAGDDVVPLDTQAIGVVYAAFRNDWDLAKQAYVFAQENFAVADRSIALSKDPATFNLTYEAKGPFSGYRPYLGKGAPDVLWFEGTAEMRFVSAFIGADTSALDASMKSWWEVTREKGLPPLGADRTVTDSRYNEYHVWPTSAAGAWTVLSRQSDDTEWAKQALE